MAEAMRVWKSGARDEAGQVDKAHIMPGLAQPGAMEGTISGPKGFTGQWEKQRLTIMMQ